jgi:L-threonylcarbamoyladenylate synthase
LALTSVLRVYQTRPTPAVIRRAVEILDEKGIVMYPTESSYALGVNALDNVAVKRLFEAKGRPSDKPVPVIVPDLKAWRRYAYFNRRAERVIRKFMPGPLTVTLRKKKLVPDMLTLFTIAARIPGHPVALALARKADYPITSTSANRSGEPPAYTSKSIPRSLRSKIDLILDAGTLKERKYSTIVDLTGRGRPVVTREGAIPATAIFRTLARGRNRR